MGNSDYIFEQGEPVQVGSAGRHDYEFASGESVTDADVSEFVFVSGIGIGGYVWERFADYSIGTTETMAAVDPDNDILIKYGGDIGDNATYPAEPELYDIENDTWTTGSPSPLERESGVGAWYNGEAFFVGGESGSAGGDNSTFQPEIYNPSTDSWRTGSAAPNSVANCSGTRVGSKVYISGVNMPNRENEWYFNYYDMATDSWATLTAPPDKHQNAACAEVDGTLYFFGDGSDSACNKYDISSGSWSNITDMPNATSGDRAIAPGDGNVYIVSTGNGCDVYQYDPDTDSYDSSVVPAKPTCESAWGSAYHNGVWYLPGGGGDGNTVMEGLLI